MEAVVKKRQKKHMDPAYLKAFETSSSTEGRCLVRCDARKYDWARVLAGAPAPWELLVHKEEFVLVREPVSSAELFVFPYGVSVLWTRSKEDEARLGPLVTAATYPVGSHEVEQEDWEFRSGRKDSVLVDEIIFDQNINPLAAKLAASTALAQEIKLSVFEEQVSRAIDVIEQIPRQMAEQGGLTISRKDINRKYGELMMIRTQINLYSDILDLPEFFYELPEGQDTYMAVSKYLQTSRRARVLNERLDLLASLYTMISEDRTTIVSHRLEWLIIGKGDLIFSFCQCTVLVLTWVKD